MITCMGLVVGAVDSPYKDDVLRQCTEFLSNHLNLLSNYPEFIIDGLAYATVVDWCTTDGFGVAFKMYDGFTSYMFL